MSVFAGMCLLHLAQLVSAVTSGTAELDDAAGEAKAPSPAPELAPAQTKKSMEDNWRVEVLTITQRKKGSIALGADT